jgi:hypothetical protein
LAKRLVGLPTPDDRTVIIDTGGYLSQEGFAPCVSAEEAGRILLEEPTFRFAVQPPDLETVEWITDGCAARSDIVFMIDELDVWYPNTSFLPCAGLRNVALSGRHHNQTGVLVTHRPQNIHHVLLSQSVLYVFPMVDALDCAAVERSSKRPDCPGGLNPANLRILERNSVGYTVRTQVARVDRHAVRIFEMTLPSGDLTTCGEPVDNSVEIDAGPRE